MQARITGAIIDGHDFERVNVARVGNRNEKLHPEDVKLITSLQGFQTGELAGLRSQPAEKTQIFSPGGVDFIRNWDKI